MVPYVMRRGIRRITIGDVQTFMNSKADYSRKMIDELWLTLGMVLNAAAKDGLISTNPAEPPYLLKQTKRKPPRLL